jgi:hypothetical protein
MPISWNEIRQNAIKFSQDWADAKSESGEKQPFWDEFFNVFGMRRRAVASFEEPVKQISGKYGHIDLFWKGMLLVEHKSRGKDLGKAVSQAFEYIQDLLREGRHDEVPQYVIVSDFARIAIHDLEPNEQLVLPLFAGLRVETNEFALADLHRNVHLFAFIAGYQQHRFQDQDPINLRAVKIMDDLHDTLEAGGYSGHELERFLVRILFCLFAEDTGIFDREAFRLYIIDRTQPDGSDLGLHLERLFAVLNTPRAKRQKNLDETLAAFPYVNGDLFAERLGFADLNRDMRNSLLACTAFNWSQISPAVFGSLFQGVMEPKERRQIGGHYTSERDILKVVRSLFLDDLWKGFESAKDSKPQLRQFQKKLAGLRFLDPACGCGNFLVIAYRELRLLEIEVLKLLAKGEQQKHFDIETMSKIDVDAFYGIEISEWPARIAEVAMWLMDHQMNVRLSEAFGQYYVRLPLTKSPTIVCDNAVRRDWKTVLPPENCSYILGNPPFVGKKEQTTEQKADMDILFDKVKGAGILDYVCCWYAKAAEYIRGTKIVCAFVSTNSITQGEQVGVLWGELFGRSGLVIHFAHRTFAWESEAKGKAHVHVVIIGFAEWNPGRRTLFEYEDPKGEPHAYPARNINGYLADAPSVAVLSRTRPISPVPEICYGSMMIDKDRGDGNDAGLILNPENRRELLSECPRLKPYIRRLYGGDEFLNGTERWCLWLVGAPASLFRESRLLRERIEKVRRFRLGSGRPMTRKRASTPTLFGEIRQPTTPYLLIPKVSSETRRYIPIGFVQPDIIASGSTLIVPGATVYHFGVLSSLMHNAWVRHVGGRLESRLQYSNKLVYNTFPWPESPSEKRRAGVEAASRKVVSARDTLLVDGVTLSDLYDPLAMPPVLVKAHETLDRAVDRCYRTQPFSSDRQRVEFLFELYAKLTKPLIPSTKAKRRK